MADDFIPGATVSVTAGATAQSIQVKNAGAAARVRLLASAAAYTFFFKFGDNTVVATAGDTPFNSGAIEQFCMQTNETHVSIISPQGSVTLYVTQGAYV
jgi:hypothetical protein